MTDNNVQKFLGGSPGSVLLKLALLSLLVGALFAAFGLTPWGFINFVRISFEELIGTGMEAVNKIAGFIVSGAIIVVPIWLLVRFLSGRN